MIEAVLIAGPTASGKSAAAIALARKIGGAIVNADSMQVYSELSLLSARPCPEDEKQAPHRLYGFVSVREAFSVAKWAAAAKLTLAQLKAERLIPIVTGGTGLYFFALEKGLSPVPEVHAELRVQVRQRYAELGPERFYAELAARDPLTAAQLNPADGQRVIRAFEVLEQTGQPLAEWQAVKGTPLIDPARCLRLVIRPNRDWLYQRCDARFGQMMAHGALDEARRIAAMALDPSLPASRALGLGYLIRHLAGELSLDAAVFEAKRDTRRYAKRQMTWFRHQMPDWHAVAAQGGQGLESALLSLAGAAGLDAVQRNG
ncbi:MAG: tRNA (adenosine(37)-N6)-dimethylallyltransferase MiaA [Alphaproteobacteria bacterium]|nr:tRNA (adenosine(37)-N6)-dimethylallyltransferase MiaA [Alphaproteobacteria bacterium]